MRTEQLGREFGLSLRHTVFPLHPETPEQGMDLTDLFAGRHDDLDAMFARLSGVAAELGLPLGERTHTYNSRRAQELGKWAEQFGKGDEFRAAVYRAYFAAGRDISRANELVAITAELGLPVAEARRALQEQSFSAAVEADWQRAREIGVSAVPTVRFRDRLLVGFTPYEQLSRLVRN